MSEQTTDQTVTRPDFKKQENTGSSLKFTKPAEFKVGEVIAEGELVDIRPNSFNAEKNDFTIQHYQTKEKTVLNASGNLGARIAARGAKLGDMIEVIYRGQEEVTMGEGKKAKTVKVHQYEVNKA